MAGSPDSGPVYPHTVGLASHRRNGNFGEVWAAGEASIIINRIQRTALRTAADAERSVESSTQQPHEFRQKVADVWRAHQKRQEMHHNPLPTSFGV